MSIQTVIDTSVDSAVLRGDFKNALRMRWLSHANNSATIEPDQIIEKLWEIRETPEGISQVGE